MKKFTRFFAIAVSLLFVAFNLSAQTAELPKSLEIPSAIGDNMVLQQNSTVNIWGYAKPKAKVSVACDWIAGKPVSVKADAEGVWIVPVAVPAASFDPHTVTIKCGKEVVTLSNILFGEVWLCSGQSNMEWPVRKTLDMKKDLEGKMNTNIRLLCTGRIAKETPQRDIPVQEGKNTKWAVCNPKDLAEFSAVGYGFGKELQETLGVPVGLVDASYGGTFIEGWMKKEVIDADPKVAKDCTKIKHKVWRGKESHLYNANIYPIRHNSFAGVIWYQGCANVSSSPRGYAHALEVLVNSWREEFENPTMPFYIVQLVPHTYGGIKGAQLRESQEKAAKKIEHCEVIGTLDQLDIPGDIHPRYKGAIAHRLAQTALGEHYGKSVGVYRNPAYKSMSIEGNSIRISLNHVPTTLTAEGRINGFQIGVTDPKNEKKLVFCLAEAKLEGKQIVVTAEGVTAPKAVRYCFNEDVGNVFSAEGLPLLPFRTDKNNSSLSAKPYVEPASEIAVTVEAKKGYYTLGELKQGAHMWPNLKQKVSEVLPQEFEGFKMLTANSIKKHKTAGGKITAAADGRVYCLARNTADIRKYHDKHGWKLIIPAEVRAVTPDGKKIASQYICYRDVKAGETVDLPRVKDHYSLFVVAKEITLVEVE
jgi:sialate O-acetylesterase